MSPVTLSVLCRGLLFLWVHSASASAQTRSDVDIRGLSFRASIPQPCGLLEIAGGVNEATYRNWVSGTGAPAASTTLSIDGVVTEYTGTNQEECACLAGPRTAPCWITLGLGLAPNTVNKYFTRQAVSGPADLGLTSFDVNPTTRRFALTGELTFDHWFYTDPPLPEGSPAPDLRFSFNIAAQSCASEALAPGGTTQPFRFMSNFLSLANPGDLSRSTFTRSRCALAAPGALVRISLDGAVISTATAAFTSASFTQVTVEAGSAATLSQLPRPVAGGA
ncbi:hypothetical protein HXX76_004561 [Chlamydomonas incerta]|uniref:Uncharacterized protein n=1 Tax=Chlamydomonas incerta TaxID=51695 RepID=A0A835W6J4_CHLIN|nr:hypothetical protein HXX76_004561 [Chlamydomonas incerta]|eukprot:KAG2439198.1 hypothetical protein HXX76_004561 [Chlamydomonas incerta]